MTSFKHFLTFFLLLPNHFWRKHWLIEVVRLQEHNGRLDDTLINKQVTAQRLPIQKALQKRAFLLAQRQGYSGQQNQVLRWYLNAILISLCAAFALGILSSIKFLGQGESAQVNILSTLVFLLGIHWLTSVFWVVWAVKQNHNSDSMMLIWHGILFVARKLSFKQESTDLLSGFRSFLARQQASFWLPSVITHLVWLCALVGILAGLALMFLVNSYEFSISTSLISGESIYPYLIMLGDPASWLGFNMPSQETLHLTLLNEEAQNDAIRYKWSAFLLWGVFLLGVLPRFFLLLFSMAKLWQTRRPAPLPLHSGWLDLKEILAPQVSFVVDPEKESVLEPVKAQSSQPTPTGKTLIWIGYEISAKHTTPLESNRHYVGFPQVSGSQQIQKVADYLFNLNYQPHKVLVVTDARLTPDRGFSRFIAELKAYCDDIALCCIEDDTSNLSQAKLWQQQAEDLQLEWANNFQWLEVEGEYE